MRLAFAAAVLGTALVAAPVAQSTHDGRTWSSLDRPFNPNGRLRMDLVAGDYRIVGSQDNGIHLQWSLRDIDQLAKVHARADVHDRDARITTDGPSSKGLKFLMRVPARSDLYIRLTAGELRVDGIEGNKDIELHAGEIRVNVGRAEDYHHVDASVWAGELHAAPFQMFKEGLFRSFDWNGKGPYRLHARLKAGEVRLYANSDDAR